MNLDECITTLTTHNKWRRGADIPLVDVTDVGKAIDYAVEELHRLKGLEK